MSTNKYRAPCVNCHKPVEPRSGNLRRAGRRWLVSHRHNCAAGPDHDPALEAETTDRKIDSAARAAGRSDASMFELAWNMDQGNY